MKRILILGSGQSTGYLVDYLLRKSQEKEYFLTVCDRNLETAQRLIGDHQNAQALEFDANDAATRASLLSQSNIVVNMLTRPFQYPVAIDCLNAGVPMITASYEDPKVHSLHNDVVKKGLLFLNEMGLDPGIDHMVAMQTISSVRSSGGIIESFRSYGSGLPATLDPLNPFHYALTWNPRNVLLAGEDGAIFKENNRIKMLPFHKIFEQTWSVEVDGIGTMEAYPNRDSIGYGKILGLEYAHTIIRGTLRYPGWGEVWQQIINLGMTNETIKIPDLPNMTYREFTEMFLPEVHGAKKLEHDIAGYLYISPTGEIIKKLKWFGLFSKDKIGGTVTTAAEVMIDLMKKKFKLPEGMRDMVVLMLEIEAKYEADNGRRERILHTMIEIGTEQHTAIAKTVGLPVAIGTELMLEGKLQVTGCHIPIHASIYEPVLQAIRQEGIVFKQFAEPIQ